jgi:hypothetical protein
LRSERAMEINLLILFWGRQSQITSKVVGDVNADVRAGVVVGTDPKRKIERQITVALGRAQGTKCSQEG